MLIKLIIAIMEVETWFLGEGSHFEKIDSSLTTSCINSHLKINIEKDDLENDNKYAHPAEVLNRIYKIIGKEYDKKKDTINEIVEKLDYELIYCEVKKRLESLCNLVDCLDEFFEELTIDKL